MDNVHNGDRSAVRKVHKLFQRQGLVIDLIVRPIRENDLEIPTGVGLTPDKVLSVAFFSWEWRGRASNNLLCLFRRYAMTGDVLAVPVVPNEDRISSIYRKHN